MSSCQHGKAVSSNITVHGKNGWGKKKKKKVKRRKDHYHGLVSESNDNLEASCCCCQSRRKRRRAVLMQMWQLKKCELGNHFTRERDQKTWNQPDWRGRPGHTGTDWVQLSHPKIQAGETIFSFGWKRGGFRAGLTWARTWTASWIQYSVTGTVLTGGLAHRIDNYNKGPNNNNNWPARGIHQRRRAVLRWSGIGVWLSAFRILCVCVCVDVSDDDDDDDDVLWTTGNNNGKKSC